MRRPTRAKPAKQLTLLTHWNSPPSNTQNYIQTFRFKGRVVRGDNMKDESGLAAVFADALPALHASRPRSCATPQHYCQAAEANEATPPAH
eukprot:9275071-Pyramimonas_sp.AAC.1